MKNDKLYDLFYVLAAVIQTFSLRIDPPIIINIDKPFMYAIVHQATNTVLFQGHVKLPVN